MERSRSWRGPRGLALTLMLAACTEDTAPAEEPGELLPARVTSAALPKHSLRALRSDVEGVEFGGSGSVSIAPLEHESTERRVTLRAELWNDDGDSAGVSLHGQLTSAELASLARGERLTFTSGEQGEWPTVGLNSRSLGDSWRPVLAATMTREAHSARLVLEVGDELVDWPPPSTEPVAPITVELRGQFVVNCGVFRAAGSPISDPMWRSDFCSTARSELGLSEWIEDLL